MWTAVHDQQHANCQTMAKEKQRTKRTSKTMKKGPKTRKDLALKVRLAPPTSRSLWSKDGDAPWIWLTICWIYLNCFLNTVPLRSCQIVQVVRITIMLSHFFFELCAKSLADNHQNLRLWSTQGTACYRFAQTKSELQIIRTTAHPVNRCFLSSSTRLQKTRISLCGKSLLARRSAVQNLPLTINQRASLHRRGAQDFHIASAELQVMALA